VSVVRAFIALLALILSGLAWQPTAQEDELPPVAYPALPTSGASAEAFIPAGWTLEKTAAGDLNKDGKPDLVLLLRNKDPENIVSNLAFTGEPFDSNPRLLAVALADGEGFRLILEDHTFIPRPDNPAQEDPMGEDGSISIDRGSLVVSFHFFMTAGGSDAGNWSYRLRLEEGKFRLIGYDSFNVNRMSGETEELSINYLNGKVTVKTGSIGSDEVKMTTKKLNNRMPVWLEDIGNGLMYAVKY
jgi:hypothetical protein